MQITGGKFKNKKISTLGKGDPKNHLRPTRSLIRQAIFNLITNGGYNHAYKGDYGDNSNASYVENKRVLDLFAGSGLLGFESLSRGASHVTFVEKNKIAQSHINANCAKLGLKPYCKVIIADATKLNPNNAMPYDLVFLDPPYHQGLGHLALNRIATKNWLSRNALIIWEEGEAITPPLGFDMCDHRQYGKSHLHILRYQPSE